MIKFVVPNVVSWSASPIVVLSLKRIWSFFSFESLPISICAVSPCIVYSARLFLLNALRFEFVLGVVIVDVYQLVIHAWGVGNCFGPRFLLFSPCHAVIASIFL